LPMCLAHETIITAYLAAESLPPGTEIFLDADGDIAYKEDQQIDYPPPGFTMLCVAEPGRFPLRNITISEEQDTWRVAGYGNDFQTKLDALVFAVHHIGIYVDDLEPFTRHLLSNAKHNTFEA